jgi:hypothetical protein
MLNMPCPTQSTIPQIMELLQSKDMEIDAAWEAKNWNSYIFAHARPYRIHALGNVLSVCRASKCWKVIIEVWMDSEHISQHYDEWMDIWARGFDNNGTQRKMIAAAMSQKSKLLHQSLPEYFTVYRGYSNEAALRGFSWTTNRDKALWFAKRSGRKDSFIAALQISKAEALIILDDRSEQEVILLADWIDLSNCIIESVSNE